MKGSVIGHEIAHRYTIPLIGFLVERYENQRIGYFYCVNFRFSFFHLFLNKAATLHLEIPY